jgi:hypothetical protein
MLEILYLKKKKVTGHVQVLVTASASFHVHLFQCTINVLVTFFCVINIFMETRLQK